MKNKKLTTFALIGSVILIMAGVFVLTSNKKPAVVQVEQAPIEDQISIVKPEEIGLSLMTSSDDKKVIFEIANTEGISGIEYELTYTSKVNRENVVRGANGSIEIKQPGQSAKKEITLGTCSDVCHYDEDVSNIKLILKVTKADGSMSQVEKSLEI